MGEHIRLTRSIKELQAAAQWKIPVRCVPNRYTYNVLGGIITFFLSVLFSRRRPEFLSWHFGRPFFFSRSAYTAAPPHILSDFFPPPCSPTVQVEAFLLLATALSPSCGCLLRGCVNLVLCSPQFLPAKPGICRSTVQPNPSKSSVRYESRSILRYPVYEGLSLDIHRAV